jgi:hypothetical protein
MAAPAIQLNSGTDFELFHPSIKEYVQGVEKAIASGNLEAAQLAHASLRKAAQTPAGLPGGQPGTPHSQIQQAIEAAGTALSEGDMPGASNILLGLRQGALNSSATAEDSGQSEQNSAPPSAAEGTDPAPDGASGAAPHLNVEA